MDSIMYWNAVAIEADRTTHTTLAPSEAGVRGPAGSSRALAIVHLAMHDAYFGINSGKYEPYLGAGLPTVPADADTDAAIAGAAHATLSALYPTQKAVFDAQHAAAGLTAGKSDAVGHVFGRKVAAAILALRKDDPSLSDDGYASSVAPGHHRKDPDTPNQPFYAPFYGAQSHCFAVNVRQHLGDPPRPPSAEYTRAVRQVRTKGITPQLTGTLPADLVKTHPPRTPNETSIGVFWSYDGTAGLGTPPRLYNQVIREVANGQGNDVAQNARLFALFNAAMGDAGILAWTDKYFYDVWRPVLGIREHDSSSGPTGVGNDVLDPDADPGWLPFGAQNSNSVGANGVPTKDFTPPFPAYPSGHATFGGAVFQSVRQFYGQGKLGPDTLAAGLEFVSDELNGITTDNNGTVRQRRVRSFPRGLWEMMQENGFSRTFLGVHWLFDAFAVDADGEIDLTQNVGGVRLGIDIANDIAANGLHAARAAGPATL